MLERSTARPSAKREYVKKAWGVTIRDGYGQTETTCQIGNPPGQKVKPGSMGRPLPGFPAGILQPPFYTQGANDAVNYGAIGPDVKVKTR